MTYRLTQKRRQMLIDLALEQAKYVEGSARTRCLEADDVEALIDACRSAGKPIKTARVYAEHGNFVANGYKYPAFITICEMGPLGLPMVSRTGAKRPFRDGPWVTINGRSAA